MKTHVNFILIWGIIFLPQVLQAQLLSVSGYVKNHVTGNAVENATVYEKLSGIGTITNDNGYYRLLLNRGKQDLKISGNGFEPFSSTFKLSADTIVSVDLAPVNMPNLKILAGNKQQKDTATSTAGKPEQPRKRK